MKYISCDIPYVCGVVIAREMLAPAGQIWSYRITGRCSVGPARLVPTFLYLGGWTLTAFPPVSGFLVINWKIWVSTPRSWLILCNKDIGRIFF